MTLKKILGIVLAVLFGGAFVIGVFTLLFWAAITIGMAIWKAILFGLAPFVGAAFAVGVGALIEYLLYDSNK